MILSPLVACLALLGGLPQQPGQWPEQLNDPNWKPHIGYLREATAIAGQLLRGPRLLWNGPGGPAQWTLVNAPSGMKLNASGKIQWPSPVEGRYLVRIQARCNGELEEADWYLNVLKIGFPDGVVYSTRHMDYVVPNWYAEWMDSQAAYKVIDGYYEFGRDLVGGFPSDARQSILFDLSIGGAHSGDPIVSGKVTLGDNDANHWRLGFLFHELGHDLNAWTHVGILQSGDGTVDRVLHDMVEFDKIAWVMRMLNAPRAQGVTDPVKFEEWMKAESMEFVSNYQQYVTSFGQGGKNFLDAGGDSAVWAGMVHTYAFKYGGEALETCIRAIRNDGIPRADYAVALQNSGDRLTFLMCIMSIAAGKDLRQEFHSMGMPVNDALYARLRPRLEADMADLPAKGINGAIKCPLDGHYYCMTPYHTNWAQAEATARRMGGHLATIRSPQQEFWLSNRYANNGWLWVGCRRNANGAWPWITGEVTDKPIWEPERPESDPNKTCGVLIYHDDPGRGPWCGLANRPPDENLFGLMEFDKPPELDVDALP